MTLFTVSLCLKKWIDNELDTNTSQKKHTFYKIILPMVWMLETCKLYQIIQYHRKEYSDRLAIKSQSKNFFKKSMSCF